MSIRRTVPVIVVGMLTLAAVVIATLVGAEEQAEGPGTLAGASLEQLTKGGDILNRAEFAVCVDAAGGDTVQASDTNMVRRVLETALVDSPDISYRLDQGCPPPVGLTGRALDEAEREFNDTWRRLESPESASPYVLAVYFVPSDVYSASFEDAVPYALATEERICRGDICAAVTAGLYVTSATTQEELLFGVLELYGAVPTRYEACTGELSPEPSWCDEYREDVGLEASP